MDGPGLGSVEGKGLRSGTFSGQNLEEQPFSSGIFSGCYSGTKRV